MTHTTILKRSDGSKVKIIARFYTPSMPINESEFNWSHTVFACEPNKRKFLTIRPALEHTVATPSEILAAKLELWELLKPTI